MMLFSRARALLATMASLISAVKNAYDDFGAAMAAAQTVPPAPPPEPTDRVDAWFQKIEAALSSPKAMRFASVTGVAAVFLTVFMRDTSWAQSFGGIGQPSTSGPVGFINYAKAIPIGVGGAMAAVSSGVAGVKASHIGMKLMTSQQVPIADMVKLAGGVVGMATGGSVVMWASGNRMQSAQDPAFTNFQ